MFEEGLANARVNAGTRDYTRWMMVSDRIKSLMSGKFSAEIGVDVCGCEWKWMGR